MAKIIPCRDDSGNLPAGEYRARIILASSILSHRCDQTNHDIIDVQRALDGWTVEDLLAFELDRKYDPEHPFSKAAFEDIRRATEDD